MCKRGKGTKERGREGGAGKMSAGKMRELHQQSRRDVVVRVGKDAQESIGCPRPLLCVHRYIISPRPLCPPLEM